MCVVTFMFNPNNPVIASINCCFSTTTKSAQWIRFSNEWKIEEKEKKSNNFKEENKLVKIDLNSKIALSSFRNLDHQRKQLNEISSEFLRNQLNGNCIEEHLNIKKARKIVRNCKLVPEYEIIKTMVNPFCALSVFGRRNVYAQSTTIIDIDP